VPLHLSPVIIPLHRPEPELPTSRPLPLALEAPTDIWTETAPEGLMPPVTLPPPADETRRPVTVNGTLLVELQLPARVVNSTFQTPSKAPGAAALGARAASAGTGAPAIAARTVAANAHRNARMGLKSARAAVGRANVVILPCPFRLRVNGVAHLSAILFCGSSLPIQPSSAISPNFIARLIKGCRVDARAGCFDYEIIEHFQRSNEHLSRESASLGAFFCGNRRAKCPS
jgi:hypothetical protein